jgi:hypothetical protein
MGSQPFRFTTAGKYTRWYGCGSHSYEIVWVREEISLQEWGNNADAWGLERNACRWGEERTESIDSQSGAPEMIITNLAGEGNLG